MAEGNRQLDAVIADWQHLGSIDPMWAVLTDPRRDGGRWDATSFFAAGRSEIRTILKWLESQGLATATPGRAADFGCGIGRVTAALGAHFGQCVGIDAAESMIETARRLHEGDGRLRFLLNKSRALDTFGDHSFDFVYSNIVLQHIPPPFAAGYISELIRITKPSGLCVFEVPTARWRPPRLGSQWAKRAIEDWRVKIALRTRIRAVLGRSLPQQIGGIQMHSVRERQIRRIVDQANREILARAFSNACDPAFNGDLQLSASPIDAGGFVSSVFAIGARDRLPSIAPVAEDLFHD